MRRILLLPAILLLSACNWTGGGLPSVFSESSQEEAAVEEEPSGEEVSKDLLTRILVAMSEAGREKREAMARQDSLARVQEAEDKAAQEAAWEAGREAQRWWKKDFSITVERPEMMNSRWVIKRKGDRFYQSRTGAGITQYYLYYNKDGKVGSYSTVGGNSTHNDKSIDDMLEKWLKEVGVFLGYDYVHDYFDNTGQTKTYAGRTVEVWENQRNTIYVDSGTGAVLYQKAPKGESTTVKAFSTKVDVSDIASHLPKI